MPVSYGEEPQCGLVGSAMSRSAITTESAREERPPREQLARCGSVGDSLCSASIGTALGSVARRDD
jgi:hypothetical protein